MMKSGAKTNDLWLLVRRQATIVIEPPIQSVSDLRTVRAIQLSNRRLDRLALHELALDHLLDCLDSIDERLLHPWVAGILG